MTPDKKDRVVAGESLNEGGDPEISEAFDRTVDEGAQRLSRTWPGLFATGLVGGIDIGTGIFALLVVQHATGSRLLGALAFPIGFIALTLARSELFTENFLVPIAAVVAGRAGPLAVARLWAGTMATNLMGGWVMMGVVVSAFPRMSDTALDSGAHFPELGITWTALASAILAGTVMTLMTWMERGTDSMPAKLVAAYAVGFLMAAGQLNHAVVGALEMIGALHVGAPFGYADWFGTMGWAILGNMLGGVVLVTGMRLVQVGASKIREERARSDEMSGAT